jgi:hypothetical protein
MYGPFPRSSSSRAVRRLRVAVGQPRVAKWAHEDVDRAECLGRPARGSGGTRPIKFQSYLVEIYSAEYFCPRNEPRAASNLAQSLLGCS